MCILCTSSQYSDGSKCVTQKTYGLSCGSTGECLTTGGLSCKNGMCGIIKIFCKY